MSTSMNHLKKHPTHTYHSRSPSHSQFQSQSNGLFFFKTHHESSFKQTRCQNNDLTKQSGGVNGGGSNYTQQITHTRHSHSNQMCCFSSKHIKKHHSNKKDVNKKQSGVNNGGSNYTHHVVSLISSTYRALIFDKDQPPPLENNNSPPPDIINIWELMADLDNDDEPQVPQQLHSRLFDPHLVSKPEETNNVTPTSPTSTNSMCCEENAVVIYTTTLRAIRKTFQECNTLRAIIQSHRVRIIERDLSMDSGFKQELRTLLGTEEVKVPAMLVRGRLIGGSEEIVKLEEEGKFGILLQGIPPMTAGCKRCDDVRFTICTACNGSCNLIGLDEKRSVKCIECNENGLVKCPRCS